METLIEQLHSYLKQELDLLKQFLSVLQSETEALINFDGIEALSETTQQKTSLPTY